MEPAIGHLKHNNGMDRCRLQGAAGDALHAVLCAAGYNIRWLLCAIVRLGLKGLLLRLIVAIALANRAVTAAPGDTLDCLRIDVRLIQRLGQQDEFRRADYLVKGTQDLQEVPRAASRAAL